MSSRQRFAVLWADYYGNVPLHSRAFGLILTERADDWYALVQELARIEGRPAWDSER